MIEALKLGFGFILLGGLLFGFAYAVRSFVQERIPQEEIDREARELIATHGANAVSVAEGNTERAQWAKGNNDKRQRAERVLKAVRASAGFLG